MTIERRFIKPGSGGRCDVDYPPHWIVRHGEPPTEARAEAAWVELNTIEDELEKRGES